MAALARRAWADIRAELLRSSLGANYPDWQNRADAFLWEAYLDIACLYHHPQLEAERPMVLAVNENTLAYPDDCVLAVALAELDEEKRKHPRLYIEPTHVAIWAGSFSALTPGRPTRFSTFRRTIFFDRLGEKERSYKLFYLRMPRRPDLVSTSEYPEIGEQWDGHLIELALYKAATRIGQERMAERNAKLFIEFAQQQPQPRIVESTAPNRPETATANRPQGGYAT